MTSFTIELRSADETRTNRDEQNNAYYGKINRGKKIFLTFLFTCIAVRQGQQCCFYVQEDSPVCCFPLLLHYPFNLFHL